VIIELTILAKLTVKLPLHLAMTRLKGLLGHTPDKNRGRYNLDLKHITRFTVNLYINAKGRVKVLNKVAEVINSLQEVKTIYRLELMILKSLRKAYLLTTNPTD